MGRAVRLRDRLRDCLIFFPRTVSKCGQKGVQLGGELEVAHGSEQPRFVLGVPLTTQTVVLMLSVLAVGLLIGLAVLNWLERQA